MKVKVNIDEQEKIVDIPFWQAFKVWAICYLGLFGMLFLLGFVIGIISAFI